MHDGARPYGTVTFSDPERLVTGIRGAELDPIQLSRRPAASSLTRLVCADLCLDLPRLGPAMLFRGAMPAGAYTLTYVLRCPTPGRAFNFEMDHGHGYLGFFPPGAALDAFTPEGYEAAILTVAAPAFHRALAVFFPEMPDSVLQHGAGLRVGSAADDGMRRVLADFADALRDPAAPLAQAAVQSSLRGDLLAAFLGALRSGCANMIPVRGARTGRRHRLLGGACDYLTAHQHRAVSVDDLSRELRMSDRAVQLMFRDFLGVSPSTFLRHRRLHSARRALHQAVPASGVVKQVALGLGFWHLGRFARDYRALFGESPHETLARTDGPGIECFKTAVAGPWALR